MQVWPCALMRSRYSGQQAVLLKSIDERVDRLGEVSHDASAESDQAATTCALHINLILSFIFLTRLVFVCFSRRYYI